MTLCTDLSHGLHTSLCNGSHWQHLKGLLYLYANVFSAKKQEGDNGCYKRRSPAIGAPGRKWEPKQPPDQESGSVPATGSATHVLSFSPDTQANMCNKETCILKHPTHIILRRSEAGIASTQSTVHHLLTEANACLLYTYDIATADAEAAAYISRSSRH